MPKLFAMIKWIGGEDDGKISVGVPTDWIMNFNFEEFLSENFDPDLSYVIESRQPVKKPAGGWPKFDGLILDVASTVLQLERKSVNYVYPKSSRIITSTKEIGSQSNINRSTQPSGSTKKRPSDGPISPAQVKIYKKTSRIYDTSSDSEQSAEDALHDDQRTPLRTLNPPAPVQLLNIPRRREEVVQINHDDDIRENANDASADGNRGTERGDAAAGGDVNEEVLQINNQPPANPQAENRRRGRESPIRNAARLDDINPEDFRNLANLLQQNIRNHEQQDREDEDANLVEVGFRGSGVTLSKLQWNAAIEQRTFTAMAITLVMSLFERDVLLKSNVKGGKNKIRKPAENVPRHQALDPHILQAITEAVRKKFPNSFKRVDMHRAINVKLNTLRREVRLHAEAAAAGATFARAAV
ncbi:uncharacterized protein [Fopius arisanus]|uniref:BEN domain-containing protein n=1 Tax=Fopius arisanus TaxID=64838 RepID=A0A9R1TNQ4_9HYME|nr:PREDICTED: uncharacterized protein LOC105272112 [Fopius arisanus]